MCSNKNGMALSKTPHSKTAPASANSNIGFSLIETLVTMAIVAILAGIAIPDMSRLLANNRVNSVSSELFSALSAARSYAINQHALVHVCAINPSDNTKCSENYDFNTDWSDGWLIFLDTNSNNNLDRLDTVLQVKQTSRKANIVFNQRGRLRFFPNGSARSAGFYVCDKAQTHFKHVLLLHTGRARTKTNLSQRQQQICGSASET